MTRPEALTLLLSRPDELCLPRRASVVLWPEPARDPDVLKRDLGVAYVERRRQEHQVGGDISCVVSVARHGRIRMVA